MRTKEQTAWGRLSESAPRGRYEHIGTWTKRNRRRTNFVTKIRREPNGCWVWTGHSAQRGGKPYPLTSWRDRTNNVHVSRSAFGFLVDTFFPEIDLPNRTVSTCGVDLCISPLHRADGMVTNNTLTAEQAVEVYRARGEDPGGVAERFGVKRSQVLAIWRGRHWREVTGAPEHVPRHKVTTPDVVLAIRARKGQASSRAVGVEFGVGYKTVLRIWQQPDLSDKQMA